MIIPPLHQPRLRPVRSDSIFLNFPRAGELSFLNLPMLRPAALVRLPPRAVASQTTDDEKTSEKSSVGANMTSSISTLASRATTADTADTEVSLGPSPEKEADDKRKKKAAAAKEKRKRRKAKAAAEREAGKAATEQVDQSDEEEAEDEEDIQPVAQSALKPIPIAPTVSVPTPTASTSKTPAVTTDWADMTTEDENAEAQFITIPTGPRAQLTRFPSDPAITPRLGKFWGHDERAQDRKGKQSVQSPLSPGFGNMSRPGSTDGMDRAASPALSSGSGWQKVSRGGKRNAFGMPTNPTLSHQRYQEPAWKHDRFEDEAANRPKVSLGSSSNLPQVEEPQSVCPVLSFSRDLTTVDVAAHLSLCHSST